ncbi:MAG: 2-phospho-L-lactate guanylyltransferase [Acidimicrobiales bacterium]
MSTKVPAVPPSIARPEGRAAFPVAASLGRHAVLVPVKAFGDAKRRLGDVLDDHERMALVRRMAEGVLASAHPLPTAVVCDDPGVAAWARDHGALVVWEPGRGLNGAVEAGIAHLTALGVELVTVAHGDLPNAAGVGTMPEFDGVTLVPDRRGDGTNVIRLPTGTGFRFAYGPGSFRRHRDECRRNGLPYLVMRDSPLNLDVDVPSDLRLVTRQWATKLRTTP